MPAVTLTERFNTEDGDNSGSGSTNLYFLAEGSDDYVDVAATFSSIPSTVDGRPRQRIRHEHIGNGYWNITAEFSSVSQSAPQRQPELGGPELVSWQSVSTTITRTHAPVSGAWNSGGATAAINGDAINVTDEGIQGVDVETSIARFTIRSVISPAQASTAYGKTLAAMCRKKAVNNALWRGFAAHEARFVDFSMDERGDGDWDLIRVFDVDENVTGGEYAGITGIDKAAHDYVWALTERKEDATNKRLARETIQVVVHAVYPIDDFALLEP